VPFFVPLRDLEPKEDAEYDDRHFDGGCEPILRSQPLRQARQHQRRAHLAQ